MGRAESSTERIQRLTNHWQFFTVVAAYLVGVYWRWHHITVLHDPRDHIYSDMKVYISAAQRIANPSYQLQPYDVTHPPATAMLFSEFLQADPSMYWLMILQFVVSALIPLAIGALAWVTFDRRAAGWSVIVSSAYFFYVEYGSFFLSEIYMMLLIPLTLTLYLLAVRMKRVSTAALVGAATGGFFFLSLAFKTVAGPAILGFCGIHWLLGRGSLRKIRTVALAAMCLAATPGVYAMSQRCTAVNQGKLCFGSNKTAGDFLLGHYGRIHSVQWTDSKFGSPAAQQHGYTAVPRVGFSITDSEKNATVAWDWVNANKLDAVVLSVQHVFDLFSSNAPWPVIWTDEWATAQAHQYLFIIFLMFPSLLLCFDLARCYGVVALLRSREFLLLSVVFGVVVAVFIATGEPRYRLPFDCSFIIVGVQFYRRMAARHLPL